MASWKKVLVSGSTIDVAGLQIGSTAVTSTAAELNLLDGVSGLVQADFTKLAAVDASATELNLLDGVTGTLVTTDGSQTLSNKTINASQLSGTVANARLDAQLQDVAGLAVTDGGVIVGNGSNFVLETGATLRTSLGLGTGNTVTFSIVSGSEISGSFKGDGSALTGVAAGSLDIDNFSALGSATVAQGDNFLLSDGGTEKKVTFSNLEDSIFDNISGDATVAAGGALTIEALAVETGMLAADAVTAAKLADDAVVTANIVDLNVTTGKIAADAITGAKIADDAINSEHITDGSVDNVHLAGSIADSKLNQISTAGKVALSALEIDGGTDIGAALASSDLIIVDDGAGGTNRKATLTRLQTYMQNNLTFTTNTDTDVSVANLKTRLAGGFGSNAVTIGDSNDVVTIGNDLIVTGDLTVQGDTVEQQVTNLNVEDKFILINSGSASGDAGIIFGGAGGSTVNTGDGIFYDDSDSVFAFGEDIASNATSATNSSKIGNISTSTSVPSSAPTFQGVGTIHVKTDSEDIYIYS